MICAILANANRDTKKRKAPYVPDDFNPFSKKKTNTAINDKSMFMEALKAAFVKDKPK